MDCTNPDAISNKPQAIYNRILCRLAIVILASTSLQKGPLLIEPPRRKVRLADLKEDSLRTSASGQVKKFSKQTCSQPTTPRGPCDGNVLDLPLLAHCPASDKSQHGSSFLKDQHHTGWYVAGKYAFILLRRPVRGSGSMPLQRHHARNICRGGKT